VIKELTGLCRSIAPDYPGFGFSEHPQDYGYTPQEHAQWINALIDYLKLKGFVFVMQDWGGPIGLSIAVNRPDDVAGLVICNTWCWAPDLNARIFSLIMGGPVGKYLHLRHNFFARRVVPAGIARRDAKAPEVLKAYTDPFPTPEARMGTYVFPREIRKAAPWLESVKAKLSVLRDKPVEIVWAMKDPAFGRESYLARWQCSFPNAPVDRIEDASHYLQEDNPERVAAAVKRLLSGFKRAGNGSHSG
jgi:haloalkane dehalogenase